MDKPVRVKTHLLARLAAHKKAGQRFRDFKSHGNSTWLVCVHFREKLPSDCSLQPSGNIFGRKIPMSCSLKQQRKEEEGSTCGFLTHDEMSRRSRRHKVSILGLRKIFLKFYFLQSHVLSCDTKLIMMIRSFWI